MRPDAGTTCDRDAVDREPDDVARSSWDAAARRLAFQINAGWWLSAWLPWVAGIVAAGTFGLLYARWRHEAAGPWTLAVIAAGLAASAVAAWYRIRSRLETTASARVRLEDILGLDARLSAAAAGVGTWPAVPPGPIRWPVIWRWRRPATIVTILGVLLAVAAWLPFGGTLADRPRVIEKPADARTVERWLDALARERAVDERGIAETTGRIAEILERPRENWYEHATLEAAGALRERTEAALRELAENLATAERAADRLADVAAAVPPDLRDRLVEELRAAAAGLQGGDLRPPADLADVLRRMHDQGGGRCDRDTLRRLADAVAGNREALLKALADAPGLDREAIERALVAGVGRPARGGVQRGRGDAELALGEERDLGTDRLERIDLTTDPDRAAPDELLAIVDGEHEVDESAYTGPRAGGTVAHEGDGGMAAQIDSLLPAERAAVRRFFE